MISKFHTTAISAALALGTCHAASAAPLYHLTDLGAQSAGWSINATGEIAGWDTDQRAAYYKDGAWHRVEGHALQTTVGGVDFSSADADGYATLWMGGQRYTPEDLLDASNPHVHLEQGMAINDAGQIVAMSWYLPNESGTHAFLLTPVSN